MRAVWTRLALADLGHAHQYIAERSPTAAASIIERIEKALIALAEHPAIGRPGRVEGTRELVIVRTPFILPYRIKNQQIEILAVIHGARRWPDSF